MKTVSLLWLLATLTITSCSSEQPVTSTKARQMFNKIVGPPFYAVSTIRSAGIELSQLDFGSFELYRYVSNGPSLNTIKVRAKNGTVILETDPILSTKMRWSPERLKEGDWIIAAVFQVDDNDKTALEMIAYYHIRSPEAREYGLTDEDLSTTLR